MFSQAAGQPGCREPPEMASHHSKRWFAPYNQSSNSQKTSMIMKGFQKQVSPRKKKIMSRSWALLPTHPRKQHLCLHEPRSECPEPCSATCEVLWKVEHKFWGNASIACRAAAQQTFGAVLPSCFVHETVKPLDDFFSNSSAVQGTLNFFPWFLFCENKLFFVSAKGLLPPPQGPALSLELGVGLSHPLVNV